jgi:death-on-curing protein
LLVFLERNECFLEATEPELFRYVLQVASHRLVAPGPELPDREAFALAEWIQPRICRVGRGEKRLRFAQLRPILASYECTINVLPGNRAVISRKLDRRQWFKKGPSTLKSHVWYGDEGRDVDPSTIHKIRSDLWLDEEHGFDSTRFYDARPGIDEFIAMYRKTLRRLARV